MRFIKVKLAALSVVALLFLPSTLPSAREGGRDYSRCVHGCNETRRACDDRCSSDCREQFAGDAAQRNACPSACRDICVAQEKDCKARCLAIRKGTSPDEP